jgi:hypothetical protein
MLKLMGCTSVLRAPQVLGSGTAREVAPLAYKKEITIFSVDEYWLVSGFCNDG